MKKTNLLNGPISRVVASLGHTDSLCIADAGLPIPKDVERIDLALVRGTPPFLDVLDAITSEMCVERALLASQTKDQQPDFHAQILQALGMLEQQQGNKIEVRYVDHEDFKQQTERARAVVRSGECTPYANILLYAGVSF